MSRFAPRFSDQELLAIVRDVAEHGRPDNPGQITQSAYDEARAGAGRADTPRAWRIAQRLSSSWPEVLRLALDADNPEQVIGARTYKRLRLVLTEAEIRHSLRRVADSLGTEALSTHDYNAERERIIEQDEDRWLRGGQQEALLPTAQTIISRAGIWEEALGWADLRPRRRERPPVYPTERALDDFIADYGWAPRRKELLAYQARRGMATTDLDGDWLEWVREQLRSGPAARHGQVRIIHGTDRPPIGWDTAPITPAPDG